MKILFVGGGTGGPNAPLVAVAEYVKKIQPQAQLVFISDGKVPAKKMFARFNSPHYTIPAGKWRRYASLQNFIDIFKVIGGIVVCFFVLVRSKPNVVFSAGSYVSLPVGFVAKLLGIPLVIHQQDIIVARTNKILSSLAAKITISIDSSKQQFSTRVQDKIVAIGNPVRQDILRGNGSFARKFFKIDSNLPIILVLGGGTGAQAINEAIEKVLPALVEMANVIHITGPGKSTKIREITGYKQFEYLQNEMPHALALADVVVSRAGFSAITEFSALNKPVVLIPLPDSPQEQNAIYLEEKRAAVVLSQNNMQEKLLPTIGELLKDNAKLQELGENIGKIMPKDAAENVGEILLKLT